MTHGISLPNADGSTFSAGLQVIHWLQEKKMQVLDCNAQIPARCNSVNGNTSVFFTIRKGGQICT